MQTSCSATATPATTVFSMSNHSNHSPCPPSREPPAPPSVRSLGGPAYPARPACFHQLEACSLRKSAEVKNHKSVRSPVLITPRKRTPEIARVVVARTEGGGVLIVMHGRSHVTSDPRIPTMPGRSNVGLPPTRQTSLARSACHREVFGESHEG